MEKMGRRSAKIGGAVAFIIVVAVTVAFGFGIPGFGKYEKVKPVNGVVNLAVSKVSDGKAHYFSYADGGKELKFFLVKGSDGAIHSAFDACDVCFHEKKGYEQQGEQMLCKNCNQKFSVNRIGATSGGGCNPSHLSAQVAGSTVRISVADLKAGARFF
jgi:uncharacterized membrane protein